LMFSRRLSIGLVSIALALATLVAAPASARDKPQVLVYSGSTGYRHESIPAAVAALKSIGEKAGYGVDATEDGGIHDRKTRPVQGAGAGQQLHRSQETGDGVVR